jgi:hypothetical protein
MENLDSGSFSSPPVIKQLSVFVPNRLGELLKVTRCLDAYGLSIRSISIVEAADHAVFRLLVDRPGLAMETLRTEGYSVFESDLLGVALPAMDSDPIRRVLSALLLAELNVHYVYSLLAPTTNTPVLAVHVEDLDAAVRALSEKGLELIGQEELE